MESKAVGMIGLGIMGSAMSANLMRAGFKVVGYDVLPRAARNIARRVETWRAVAGKWPRAAKSS